MSNNQKEMRSFLRAIFVHCARKLCGVGVRMGVVLGFLIFAPGSTFAADNRPAGIVDVQTIIPDLKLDMRYLTAHNFIGRPIKGYIAPKCYLSKQAAEALKKVQEDLRPRGLGLKVYDCYRPQAAVDDFVRWGRDLSDRKMKPEFYPNVPKNTLFRSGYIARRSGHSRASTVDLTIVPLDAAAPPPYDADAPVQSCESPPAERAPDNSVDMGTSFDCFSRRSHTAYAGIGKQPKANRRLLKSLMSKHGFRNVRTEWWHYTLRNEPYPKTYFNFPVE
jgi:zinc D-Ala-D-Ala dipeptidase